MATRWQIRLFSAAQSGVRDALAGYADQRIEDV
jgi:hypothetical protein